MTQTVSMTDSAKEKSIAFREKVISDSQCLQYKWGEEFVPGLGMIEVL